MNKMPYSRKTVQSATLGPNISLNNLLSLESEVTIDSEKILKPKPTASTLVAEVLNTYFTEKSGIYERSASTCSSASFKKSSEYKIDERLRYWKETLAKRRNLGEGIKDRTGKNDCDILFNKPVTSDYRNVKTIKQVLDYADRLNPTALLSRKRFKLTDVPCQDGDQIFETLPRSERIQRAASSFEMVGLPLVTKEELAVRSFCQDKKSSWVKSKDLERRITSTATDIENVFEFYPNFDKLQIVGKSARCHQMPIHKSSIELLSEDFLKNTSSSNSGMSVADTMVDIGLKPSQQLLNYAFKINEKCFQLKKHLNSDGVCINIDFDCHPGERIEKNILRLENIGKKVLDFGWIRQRDKGSPCIRKYLPTDIVFLFDKNPFRVISGEVRDVSIVFRPHHVHKRLETYQLTIDPSFFTEEFGIFISLQGHCSPTEKYINKMYEVERIIENAASFNVVLGEIDKIIETTPVQKFTEPSLLCPNVRTLDVREVFNTINEGYECCRYHDIDLLQSIYKRIKSKDDPYEWNMSLKVLREKILLIENSKNRTEIFAEFMKVVHALQSSTKCSPPDEDREFRYTSKLQFIRSIFCSKLDRWELFVDHLQASLLAQPENIDLSYNKVLIPSTYKVPPELDVARRGAVCKQSSEQSFYYVPSDMVRKNRIKNFHDRLYIQTYSKLCDIIEDIVSIMESVDTM